MAIFISHSSADRKIAEKIYDRLKHKGVAAWISSRDIPPGGDYQACIVEAIESAELVLLVFSSNANQSPEIAKELSLASKKLVIPARIEDVVPHGSFQYQLSNRQFVDLFIDFEHRLEELCNRVKQVLDNKGGVIEPPVSRRKGVGRLAAAGLGAIALAGGAVIYLKPAALPKGAGSEVPASRVAILQSDSKPPASSAPMIAAAAPAQVETVRPVRSEATAVPSAPAQSAPAATPPSDSPKESASGPQASREGMSTLLTMLDNSTNHERLDRIRRLTEKIPSDLGYQDAEKILNGTASQRSTALGLIAGKLAGDLDGRETAVLLGDTSSHDRINALQSLATGAKLKRDLSAGEAKLILEGTGAQRSKGIALLAPYLARSLGSEDTVTVLGDTSSHDRIGAIQNLVNAQRIKSGLSAPDAQAILERTGAQRENGIKLLAPALAREMDGSQVSGVLGDTDSHSRINSLQSLVTNERIKNDLPAQDAKLILEKTGAQRSSGIALIANRLARDLNGNDVAGILGETTSHDRVNAMRNIANAGRMRKDLSVQEANVILEGTGAQRSSGVQIIAPNLASGLNGKDVAAVLGPDSGHARLNALQSLSNAGRIRQALGQDDIAAIMQGMDQAKSQAISLLTPLARR